MTLPSKETITHDFLKENDGKLVWIRDDYLSMRGVVYYFDRPLYDFLEHVDKVKEDVKQSGYEFKGEF